MDTEFRISDLIRELQQVQSNEGDLPVLLNLDYIGETTLGCYGHAFGVYACLLDWSGCMSKHCIISADMETNEGRLEMFGLTIPHIPRSGNDKGKISTLGQDKMGL